MLNKSNRCECSFTQSVVSVDVLYTDTADGHSDGCEPVLKKSTAALGFSESVCSWLIFFISYLPIEHTKHIEALTVSMENIMLTVYVTLWN